MIHHGREHMALLRLMPPGPQWRQVEHKRKRKPNSLDRRLIQETAASSSSLAVTLAAGPPSRSSSDSERRAHIHRCLGSDSDIGLADRDTSTDDDTSMNGNSTTANHICSLQAQIQQMKQAVQSLEAQLNTAMAQTTAAPAAISIDSEPISKPVLNDNEPSDLYKEVNQRLDGLDSSVLALAAQLSAIGSQLSAFIAGTKTMHHISATTPPQHTCPRNWASVASAGTRPPQTRAHAGRPRSPTANQLAFKVAGSQADMASVTSCSGDLAASLQSLICTRLSLPLKAFSITEAFPLGKILPQDPPSKRRIFLFRVLSVADAELIVRSRCALRSTQLVISDVLSPDERATHNALWPTFVEARRMGLKPQFNRARLFVSNNDKTTKYRVCL